MKKIIRSFERHLSDMGDIKSHFLFSFADYYDPANMSFGALRVFNDDFVGIGAGFPSHQHKTFEIMTIMLRGEITHSDSLGTQMKVKAGQIQVTNTGSGVYHSEMNHGDEDILLYQLWFMPKYPVATPSYFTATFTDEDYKNTFCILASGREETERKLISGVTVKRGVFDKGQMQTISGKDNVLFYVTSGKVVVDKEITLNEKDQLRIKGEGEIVLEFLEKTDCVIVESE